MANELEITHKATDEGGAFLIQDGERELGHLRWRRSPAGNLDGYTTFSDPELRGRGMARRLVDELVAMAQKEGVGILPTCPYIARVMNEDTTLTPLIRAE